MIGRAVALSVLALPALVVAACSSPTSSQSPPAPSASASATVAPNCPNTEGGLCIGPLKRGTSYSTSLFTPTITYSVPEPGWSDDEDLQGNFLLLPPKNTLAGVNAGTSDYIGVYTSIAAARFTHLPSCATQSVAEVANTPRAFSAWLRRQPQVAATAPVPVSVGGLHGLRIDLKLKPHVGVPNCTDDQSGGTVRYLPILAGEGVSSLDHGLIPHLTMRLYLLVHAEGVLGIEVDDVEAAPGTLTSLAAVAEQLRFAEG